MTVPLGVLVAQWVLLGSLALLIVLFYRQLASLIRIQQQGRHDALSVGTNAPSFQYRSARAADDGAVPRTYEPAGTWTAMVFLDPLCPTCESTLMALERVAAAVADLRTLVITVADPAVVLATETFRNSRLEIARVGRDVAQRLYKTETAPYFYIVDPDGVIRARGGPNEEAGIYALITQARGTELRLFRVNEANPVVRIGG